MKNNKRAVLLLVEKGLKVFCSTIAGTLVVGISYMEVLESALVATLVSLLTNISDLLEKDIEEEEEKDGIP